MRIESVNFGAKPLVESKSTKPETKPNKKNTAITSGDVVISLMGMGFAGYIGMKIHRKVKAKKEKEAILGKTNAIIEKAERKMREMFPKFHDNEIHLLTKLHLLFKADKLKNATQKSQVPHTIILLGDETEKIKLIQNHIQNITDGEVKTFKSAGFWPLKEDVTGIKSPEKQLVHDIKEGQKLFSEDKTRTIFDFGSTREFYNNSSAATEHMPEESAKSGVHALISAEKAEELSEKIKKDAFVIPLKSTPPEPSGDITASTIADGVLDGMTMVGMDLLFSMF